MNNQVNWGSVSKLLHWLTVLIILVIVPAGYVMAQLYGYAFKLPDLKPLSILFAQIHQTGGFILLLVVIMRIAWRWRSPDPRLQVARHYRIAARAVQLLLYGVLLALPLTGWLALSTLADSDAYGKTQIWFFASDNIIPRIAEPRPFSDPNGYSWFARIHRWLINFGAILLFIHVVAALLHQFWWRDNVLKSMWPLSDSKQTTKGKK